MTTERDRLVFAEAKGREQGREDTLRRMAEQLRARGRSEDGIGAVVQSAKEKD